MKKEIQDWNCNPEDCTGWVTEQEELQEKFNELTEKEKDTEILDKETRW